MVDLKGYNDNSLPLIFSGQGYSYVPFLTTPVKCCLNPSILAFCIEKLELNVTSS